MTTAQFQELLARLDAHPNATTTYGNAAALIRRALGQDEAPDPGFVFPTPAAVVDQRQRPPLRGHHTRRAHLLRPQRHRPVGVHLLRLARVHHPRRPHRPQERDTMSTGKDYGLPEEYADWIEVDHRPVNLRDEFLEFQIQHFRNGFAPHRPHYFVPPRPKLPDVKPGAVVSFEESRGTRRFRTVKTSGAWIVLDLSGKNYNYTGSEMLDAFDMESAVVELEGL